MKLPPAVHLATSAQEAIALAMKGWTVTQTPAGWVCRPPKSGGIDRHL